MLYEDFSHFREGAATKWGPNTSIKMGLDGRKWLVASAEGTHPVGYKMRLPNEFTFECRYSAALAEVTRGLVGWWKEPVASKISFTNDRGAKFAIGWVIRCGNDPLRLNPLGSSSLYAKKYYHAITLPDGATNEIETIQPTGMLRVDWDGHTVKIFLDGQSAAVGSVNPLGQLVGFEIEVVKAKNGALSFTDFKIAR